MLTKKIKHLYFFSIQVLIVFLIAKTNAQNNKHVLFEQEETHDPIQIKECKTNRNGTKWLLKFQYLENTWWNYFDIKTIREATIKKNLIQTKKETELKEKDVTYAYGDYETIYKESIIVKDSSTAQRIAKNNKLVFKPTVSYSIGDFIFTVDSISNSVGPIWNGCRGPEVLDTLTNFTVTAKYKNGILYKSMQTHEGGLLSKEKILNALNHPIIWTYNGNYFGITRFFYRSRGLDMAETIYLFNY